MHIQCTVNGKRYTADDAWPGESLLYVLRERFGLYGSKNACEQGECGSCSVYLDGGLVCACLVLAGQVNGREVVTVEGVDAARVQQAFVEAGAVQCGFRPPGPVVAAHDPLPPTPHPNDDQSRAALAGHVCPRTGHPKTIPTVPAAVRQLTAAWTCART